MNSRQRRKLRRWAAREAKRLGLAGSFSWERTLILRASNRHFGLIAREPACVGSRRERHLLRVLDDHRFELFGIRFQTVDQVHAGG